MTVIDRLYSLEIELHRLSRSEAINLMEAGAIHTSYALQNGDEPLLRTVGAFDSAELARAKDRMAGAFDPRGFEAAFFSLRRLIVVDGGNSPGRIDGMWKPPARTPGGPRPITYSLRRFPPRILAGFATPAYSRRSSPREAFVCASPRFLLSPADGQEREQRAAESRSSAMAGST